MRLISLISLFSHPRSGSLSLDLSASVVVRLAERCLGLAIRSGQTNGRIGKRGQHRAWRHSAKRDGLQEGILLTNRYASAWLCPLASTKRCEESEKSEESPGTKAEGVRA